eukprot:NODE_396_length_8125_cov_0.508472.p1 type:complete len:821 gc:universal NODE_396_length_8125_cov_0.508472:4774-2312(-)
MSISATHVHKELKDLQDALKNNGMPNILIVHGKSQAAYQKTSALQVKLLQYEFPDTLMFVSQTEFRVYASSKKCKLLEPFGSCVTREKDYSNIDEYLANLPSTIGVLSESSDDTVVQKVQSWLQRKDSQDLQDFVSKYLSIKTNDEIGYIAKACSDVDDAIKLAKNVLGDLKRKITHMQLARLIEKQFPDSEFCYLPIVQTSEYNLKPSAVSNSSFLDQEYPVVLQLGIRNQAYCTNIARTFLPAPTQQQTQMYGILVELFEYALSNIVPGAICSSIYTKFVAYIRQKHENLETHILKSLGFMLGIEFRDKNYQFKSDCEAEIEAGMVFTLTMGLNNLRDKDMTYSLYLADTIVVETSSSRRLTNLPYDLSFMTLEMTKKDLDFGNMNGTRKRTRHGGVQEDDLSKQQERRIHQKQLYAEVQERGLKRHRKGDATGDQENDQPAVKKFDSYKRDYQLPRETIKMKIMVDTRNESILLPICGTVVPFHITTLKNISKNEESDYVYLRLNFITPGQVSKKDEVPYEDSSATFVRSLTFRSSDAVRFNSIYKEITDLKRNVSKKEAEQKDKANLVEQDKLIEVKGRRPLGLRDVLCRPKPEGKQVSSPLEIHSNGLRYKSELNNSKVDILFSNIEVMFFQPCDNENYVILHCYLKDHIMINKKKTRNVQFYRETSEGNDETQLRRRGMYADDEFEEEQEEKRRKAKLNREFKQFGEKIVELSGNTVEIDVPFRELGFTGVPFRTSVLMQPTSDFLVHLTDPPFLVVPIREIEVVHLERVQFGLKNFDMVIIYRDFTLPITQITAIPTTELEMVREWLEYFLFI